MFSCNLILSELLLLLVCSVGVIIFWGWADIKFVMLRLEPIHYRPPVGDIAVDMDEVITGLACVIQRSLTDISKGKMKKFLSLKYGQY